MAKRVRYKLLSDELDNGKLAKKDFARHTCAIEKNFASTMQSILPCTFLAYRANKTSQCIGTRCRKLGVDNPRM